MKNILLIFTFIWLAACTKSEPTPPPVPAAATPSSTPTSAVQPWVPEMPASIRIKADDMICEKDSDCAQVHTRCSCDCGTGINKTQTAKYAKELDQLCRQHPAHIVCRMKCDGKVKCQNHICIYLMGLK
jgi:hypothetical protein